MLEHIVIATRDERPIVMFTEDQDPESMEAAVEAGVSAYMVAGLQGERIKPVLQWRWPVQARAEAAGRAQRHQEQAGRAQGDRARQAADGAPALHREQAYQKLRSMAMSKNLKLSEVAQRILDVEDLLG
jgi:response regulator NasT